MVDKRIGQQIKTQEEEQPSDLYSSFATKNLSMLDILAIDFSGKEFHQCLDSHKTFDPLFNSLAIEK